MLPADAGSKVTSAVLSRLHHGLFLALVVVGAARSLATGASALALAAAVAALLGWYAVGVRVARRPARMTAIWWLAILTVLWLVSVAVSPENVWVSVSLWLLAGHFLRVGPAVAYSVVVLAVVIGAQWQSSMPLGSASIVGPTVGAGFSLALSLTQHRLVRDAVERQRLLDSLVKAQAESEELHADLAAAQHESGVLAERARLSRDIHDGLAQNFSSILLTARSTLTGPDPERWHHGLRQVEALALDGLEESRRVVSALAPKDLRDTGLTASLRRTLADLGAQTGIATDLHVDGELTSLPTGVEVALLRVAQGALANVRHHSRADRVVVTLTDTGDSVRLDIVDDGVGFDPATVPDAGRSDGSVAGYGLRSSRDRLRALGGGLDIESRPGEGTALTAYLPLTVVPDLVPLAEAVGP